MAAIDRSGFLKAWWDTEAHVSLLAGPPGFGKTSLLRMAAWSAVYPVPNAFGVEVVRIPSPGLIEQEGEAIPASYLNFFIGNATVVVPVYGTANDQAAVETIGALFPDHIAVGLRADHILTGGGSFHCISQQLPAGPKA